MAINGVGSNNYNYGNYTQNNVNKTQSTNTTENTVQTKEDLLKELNQIYPDLRITTGNVTEDNYAKFAGGTGMNNMVISDKYLEEAARDPETKAELIQTIQETQDSIPYRKSRYANSNRDLYATGFMITDKGTVTSWSSTRVLDTEKEARRQETMKQNLGGNQSLFSGLDNKREQRKLDEEYREEKRLEKRDLERREQKKEDEKRLEEKREEKRMEEKRQLEQLNNEDILNSSLNKVVVDTYKKDINFENTLSNFNTEI